MYSLHSCKHKGNSFAILLHLSIKRFHIVFFFLCRSPSIYRPSGILCLVSFSLWRKTILLLIYHSDQLDTLLYLPGLSKMYVEIVDVACKAPTYNVVCSSPACMM